MSYGTEANPGFSTYTGLPQGMDYDENGNIFWDYEDEKEHTYFRLEKDQLCYKFLPLSNKRSILNPRGKYATHVRLFAEFPESELSRSFQSMKWIKPLRKKNCIKINSADAIAQIYVRPHQFDFVLNYLIVRCPGAKVKEKGS